MKQLFQVLNTLKTNGINRLHALKALNNFYSTCTIEQLLVPARDTTLSSQPRYPPICHGGLTLPGMSSIGR